MTGAFRLHQLHLSVVAVLSLVACSVDRGALSPRDAGHRADSGHPDAALPDSGFDAQVTIDSGVDARTEPEAGTDDSGTTDGGDAGETICAVDGECAPRSCHEANCAGGQCVYTPQPFGLALDEEQTEHDCQAVYCDGSGTLITLGDSLDPPLEDGNPCTLEGCSNTTPVHVPMSDGVMLPSDDQVAGDCSIKRCSGGEVVEEADDADLPASTLCQDGACGAGSPTFTPRSAGLACGDDLVCDGTTNCVACLELMTSCTEDWQCCGGDCVGGVCGVACEPQYADCDGMDGNGCETPVNTLGNCGACGTACNLANASQSCATGACEIANCNNGFADCNSTSNDGCEQSLRTLSSCGACGVTCSRAHASATCITGTCALGVCNSSWGNCDSNATNGCETPTNTLSNCGACGVTCAFANASASCSSGVCQRIACDAGFEDCDGMAGNGCETPLNTLQNCGACGNICSGPSNRAVACTMGTCSVGACVAGFQDCDGNANNGCEWDVNNGACPCLGNDDSDADGLTNCNELLDNDPFTDPDVFNGARVSHLSLCSTSMFGPNCNNSDTLGEVITCTTRTPRQTLSQYSGWDWDDPSGLTNAINSSGFDFRPNWSGTNTSFQIDARAELNIAQTGRHCFRINGSGNNSCGSLYLAQTAASAFCGWSSLASDTEAVVQHGDSTVCLQLDAGVYPIRWHLDRASGSQGDFHLDYCYGGNGNCSPTSAIPNRMLRTETSSSCQTPASNCTQASFNSHDYWMCQNPLSWGAARTACQSVGMDLAMVGSSSENTFLTGSINTDHWIALSDALSESTWLWMPTYTPVWSGGSNGVPIASYVNWGSGEPNGDTARNCGELMTSGRWNDTTCDTAQAFICEER